MHPGPLRPTAFISHDRQIQIFSSTSPVEAAIRRRRRCPEEIALNMGQLVSLVYEPSCSLNLDLFNVKQSESAEPSTMELHARVASFLGLAQKNLTSIRDYEGNAELLRQAMSAAKDEVLQERAFASLLPKVDVIKGCHDLSTQLGEEVCALLTYLERKDLEQEQNQVFLKQLADILDFILSFDYEKMLKPALQNDFSYYRRNYAKMCRKVPSVTVEEAEAGLISMFIAQNLPMTVTVEAAVKKLLSDPASEEEGLEKDRRERRMLDSIVALANYTADVASEQTMSDECRRWAMRVMTSALVLYDRVSPTGAFNQSPIHTRKCLRLLSKAQGSTTASLAEQLISSVKFSTLHFKDASTPGSRSIL